MASRAMELARRRRASGLNGTVPMGVGQDALNSGPGVQAIELPYRNFVPNNWENIDQLAYVALPAIGADAVIISFKVPPGRNGIIRKVGNNFVGGGWTEGTGDVVWKILADGTPPPGATSYNNILGSLGSPANPTEIPGFRIFENQLITVEATNVNVVVAGQLVGARLVGYLYPRELEDANIWI